jgi:hypothetical protein
MQIRTLEHEEIRAVAHHLRIDVREHRMGKTEEIHSIEQVGLSLAIVAYETVDIGRKHEFGIRYVLIIQY